MKQYFLGRWLLAAFCVQALTGCGSSGSNSGVTSSEAAVFATKAALGESLFFDENLSLNRSQSCATCHNPEHAFIDNRLGDDGAVAAVSLGDDGFSLGDRNTPSAAYAAFSPTFGVATHARFNSQQSDYSGYEGGQFGDGRESDLQGQAGGPPLNAIEMGLADKAQAVERLQENPLYVSAFKQLFGERVWDDESEAYAAFTQSVAAFEESPEFSPFDSKYDRYLRGEYFYDPLSKAAEGKALFFSQQFTNCATCHQLQPNSHRQELFTRYEYHNIGIPVNKAVRAKNSKGDGYIDQGLFDNPLITDAQEKGKFKVPTLRNIAVTGPYMHNGVFKRLSTVVEFYDQYLTSSEFTVNPETGEAWGAPEVPENISFTELEDGKKLTPEKVEAMVCFLITLTDSRYEHLIPNDGPDCDG